MNWLKRLLGGGTVVPDDRLKEVWPLDGGTAEPPDGLPCGGTNRYHSWKPRGQADSSPTCLRCGANR